MSKRLDELWLRLLSAQQTQEKHEKKIHRRRELLTAYLARFISAEGVVPPATLASIRDGSLDHRKLPRKLDRERHTRRLHIRLRESEWAALQRLTQGRRSRNVSKIIRRAIPAIVRAYEGLRQPAGQADTPDES